MTYQVACNEDLGIAGCDFVADGEVPGDVLEELLPHLRQEHGLSMPDANAILEGYSTDVPLLGETDKGIATIVRRLQQALDVDTAPATPLQPVVTVGLVPNR